LSHETTVARPQDAAAPPDAAAPSTRSIWILFSYLAVWGYLLYGLGNATPYLRLDLHLTDFQAGLHASALACGTLAAGISADLIARRLGSSWLLDLAVGDIAVAIAMIVLAPTLLLSLAGAFLMGLGGTYLAIHVNALMGSGSGAKARKLISQVNAVSMVTAASAPVALGLAASGLHAWRVALVLPVIAFVVLTVIRPRERAVGDQVRVPRATLPGAYWYAWLLITLGVAIEFSFVFWGSTMVGRQTGLAASDATILASLFVAGMFVGRAAIGRGVGARRSSRSMLAAGLVVVLAGSILVLVSPLPILSGIGLFLGGLGTAGIWPVGLSAALQFAPRAQFQAVARATFGSGIAVLVAPSALGLAADIVGVAGAWTIIPGLAVAALAVLAVTPRPD
jgi:fucose permease